MDESVVSQASASSSTDELASVTTPNSCGVCGRKSRAGTSSSSLNVAEEEEEGGGGSMTNICSIKAANSEGLIEYKPTDIETLEDDHFWIQCDICEIWFHGK